MAASHTKLSHGATLDPIECPLEWVWAYVAKSVNPPSWWLELWSLYQRGTIILTDTQVQILARRQPASFRLPAAQEEKEGWWKGHLA